MYPYQLLKVPHASRGNRVGASLAVPIAKRGEPAGRGQLMNFGRAIGITGCWATGQKTLASRGCWCRTTRRRKWRGIGVGWRLRRCFGTSRAGAGILGDVGCACVSGLSGSGGCWRWRWCGRGCVGIGGGLWVGLGAWACASGELVVVGLAGVAL